MHFRSPSLALISTPVYAGALCPGPDAFRRSPYGGGAVDAGDETAREQDGTPRAKVHGPVAGDVVQGAVHALARLSRGVHGHGRAPLRYDEDTVQRKQDDVEYSSRCSGGAYASGTCCSVCESVHGGVALSLWGWVSEEVEFSRERSWRDACGLDYFVGVKETLACVDWMHARL